MKRIRMFATVTASVVTAFTLLVPRSAEAVPELSDLGTLGGNTAAARDINEAGQIVGDSATVTGETHAFLYTPWVGSLVDLGTLGGSTSRAFAIADRGLVVGESSSPSGETHAFIWEQGSMDELSDLDGALMSSALDVNDSGVAVGHSGNIAVRWANGVVESLGTLGGPTSVANAINSSGVIVGASTTPSGESHAFVIENGVMTDLGSFGGVSSLAEGINSSGDIVGTYLPALGMGTRGFLIRGGVFTDLGALGISSSARAIANSGLIVGSRTGSGFLVGVLWDYNLSPSDLGTLPGASVSSALSVNSGGSIVGVAANAAGFSRAVVWQ